MKLINNLLLTNTIVTTAILFSINANAKLLIEPHYGYNLHSMTTKGTDTINYNGSQYGSRLGIQSFGFMGGLDYTHSTYTAQTKPIGGITKNDEKKRDELGVFVGYKFPILIRAWAEYNFLAKETQAQFSPSSGTAAGDYYKGHSTEIGVGFTALPFASINLSYKMLSYNQHYTPGSNTTSTLNPKYEPKEIILGISIPINLP